MAKTLIAYRPEFLLHDTGSGHPETSKRLDSIVNQLQKLSNDHIIWETKFRSASQEQISLIHDVRYVRSVQEICETNKNGYFDGDTPFSSQSYFAASLAVGAGIHIADSILSNQAKNGIALVRPPGHHAESSHAMGFCLFNNIAITAKYLQTQGIKKILILDWDVHHGNGTQHQFYDDPSVYFISLHQYPFYPGTGSSEERGSGDGFGFTLNLPLPRNSNELDYWKVWPLVQKEMEIFQPEFILVSAGFDAHKADPLGGMNLETRAFSQLTQLILKEANLYAKGRLISFLEGGYHFEALADSVTTHVETLSDFL